MGSGFGCSTYLPNIMGINVCLFFSSLLFRTRYVRYLMAFWWIFLMRVIMVGFGISRLVSLLMECSCIYDPSYSGCDGN